MAYYNSGNTNADQGAASDTTATPKTVSLSSLFGTPLWTRNWNSRIIPPEIITFVYTGVGGGIGGKFR